MRALLIGVGVFVLVYAVVIGALVLVGRRTAMIRRPEDPVAQRCVRSDAGREYR
jgi:hypothetical protein